MLSVQTLPATVRKIVPASPCQLNTRNFSTQTFLDREKARTSEQSTIRITALGRFQMPLYQVVVVLLWVAHAGRTLVLIVGVGCTKSTWTPDLLHTIAESREVVIFDNRGSGQSHDKDWPDSINIDSLATSTRDFWLALGIKQPDVLGWSLGGLIALHLATHYAEAVNRFVVVSAAAPKPGADPGPFSPESPVNLWEGQIDPTLLFPNTSKGNAALCRYIKLYEAMPKDGVQVEEVRAQRRALVEACRSSDIYGRLGNITNPTLMVVGTFAGEGPPSYELVSKIPTSMVVAFSDAGHGAIFQYALLAAASIANFLDSDLGKF